MSTTLDQMGIDELKAKAQELDVKIHHLHGEEKIRELIKAAEKPSEMSAEEKKIRERVRIEEETRLEIQQLHKEAQRKLDIKNPTGRKPLYEDVEIEKSPEKKYRFFNLETPGADVAFTLGTHHYHLFEGCEYALPTFVVNTLQNECRNPVYDTPEKEDQNGMRASKKVDTRPRFNFEDLGEVA